MKLAVSKIYHIVIALHVVGPHVVAQPPNVHAIESSIPLGGSTGAYLVTIEGERWVEKQGASARHIENEFYTNKAYRALGIKVPEVYLYDLESRPTMLSQYIPGQTLAAYMQHATRKAKNNVFKKIQKGFVADCLLGNWDVVGLNFDNIIIDEHADPWRVDNGGGLFYRAQGALKKSWGGDVTELNTMRNPKLNYSAGTVFEGITSAEIKEQAQALLEKKEALIQVLPLSYRPVIERRLSVLASRFT